MRQKITELTDEQAYAIENNEKIDDCIDEFEYDYPYLQNFYEKLHNICLSIDLSENEINLYEKAEKRLRFSESEIIRLIGQKSFHIILDAIDLQKKSLRKDIKNLLDSYHNLNQYIIAQRVL